MDLHTGHGDFVDKTMEAAKPIDLEVKKPSMDLDGEKGDQDQDVEMKSAEEKKLVEWLPITSSRTAKWWYSAFHNVTALICNVVAVARLLNATLSSNIL